MIRNSCHAATRRKAWNGKYEKHGNGFGAILYIYQVTGKTRLNEIALAYLLHSHKAAELKYEHTITVIVLN